MIVPSLKNWIVADPLISLHLPRIAFSGFATLLFTPDEHEAKEIKTTLAIKNWASLIGLFIGI